MGIEEAIAGLRVVRRFEDRPLATEDLDAIIAWRSFMSPGCSMPTLQRWRRVDADRVAASPPRLVCRSVTPDLAHRLKNSSTTAGLRDDVIGRGRQTKGRVPRCRGSGTHRIGNSSLAAVRSCALLRRPWRSRLSVNSLPDPRF